MNDASKHAHMQAVIVSPSKKDAQVQEEEREGGEEEERGREERLWRRAGQQHHLGICVCESLGLTFIQTSLKGWCAANINNATILWLGREKETGNKDKWKKNKSAVEELTADHNFRMCHCTVV